MQARDWLAKKLRNRLVVPFLASRARRLASTYRIAGDYRRIYHYHVRKTAGTSLNSTFWAIGGLSMSEMAGTAMLEKNGYIFVHHRKALIEKGDYFFADAHLPAHALTLPDKTFTLTVLRDPVDRVISYYGYLMWARTDPEAERREPAYSHLRKEMRWLGGSFGDFVGNLPRDELLNQLYMFSAGFSIEEAAERIAACSFVGFTSSFAGDVERLAHTLSLPLEVKAERRFGQKIVPPPAEVEKARALLEPEYQMLALVRARLAVQRSGTAVPAI